MPLCNTWFLCKYINDHAILSCILSLYYNVYKYAYEKSHHVIPNITYHENSLDTVKNAMKNHIT